MAAPTLDNHVALVTGGSGDIGGAIARRLADAGAEVIITYVGAQDSAEAIVSDIQEAGGQAHCRQLDQRDPAAIEALMTEIGEHWQRLDILVNNAAWNIGIPFPNLDELTADIWDRVLETTSEVPFCSQEPAQNYCKPAPAGTSLTFHPLAALVPAAAVLLIPQARLA